MNWTWRSTTRDLEDARLTATRAEVARWVYTHFTEESALNLGNFRGYEAESLWELGQTEQAEALFQELTETFPTFAWGYIWWGDGYWMSDWSYEYAPDYDRAESIYRQALAQPALGGSRRCPRPLGRPRG